MSWVGNARGRAHRMERAHDSTEQRKLLIRKLLTRTIKTRIQKQPAELTLFLFFTNKLKETI